MTADEDGRPPAPRRRICAAHAVSDELFPLVTVRCFFALSGCKYTVRDIDPRRSHDLMEEHYEGVHQKWIDAIVGEMR